MYARLLACPLCSQPGFLTLDALRAGLISVATRPLICPVCNEVLLGIDKLTIHLFSHTINLNSNLAEPSKHVNITPNTSDPTEVCNIADAGLSNWNGQKAHTERVKALTNSTLNAQQCTDSSENSSAIKDKVQIPNSDSCMQDQSVKIKSAAQLVFLSAQACDTRNLNICHKSCESDTLSEALKVSRVTEYYSSDNTKHTNISQNPTRAGQDSIETFKHWIHDQHCRHHSVTPTLTRDLHKSEGTVVETAEPCEDQRTRGDSNKTVLPNDETLPSYQRFSNATPICTEISSEEFNKEKNVDNDLPDTNDKCHDNNVKNEQIMPHLKAFKELSSQEKMERCNICGFHFPDYNILLLHKQLVHMIDEKDLNVIPEEFLKNYSCHLCSKVFKMRGSLMVHMRVAHMGYNLGTLSKDGQVEHIYNENGYSCPTCGKKFKKEQHVIQHLKTHEAKQWECDVCSKMFTTKYFLKKHKRLHSGEMPYKCNICNKTFTFQQSYHKHRLYHKDDKPHMCTTCGRSFKELSTLHNHERIHTGEKPFACETCGKCFRQRVSYLVHRRIHTGVMPYKCTMCNKSFRYKVSQRTHKCPAQSASDMDPKQLQLADTQSTSNRGCKAQSTNSLQDGQPLLHVVDNEENKYILIINTEGQHLLTREADIGSTQEPMNKEEGMKYVRLSNESKELKNTWSSHIPNSPVFRKPVASTSKMHVENEKPSEEDTNDFFSMVMSPLENGLSSPTAEMEHLRVSSPTRKEDILEPYGNFKSGPRNIHMNIVNSSINEGFNSNSNIAEPLQTINEESLKQLLYDINQK